MIAPRDRRRVIYLRCLTPWGPSTATVSHLSVLRNRTAPAPDLLSNSCAVPLRSSEPASPLTDEG